MESSTVEHTTHTEDKWAEGNMQCDDVYSSFQTVSSSHNTCISTLIIKFHLVESMLIHR